MREKRTTRFFLSFENSSASFTGTVKDDRTATALWGQRKQNYILMELLKVKVYKVFKHAHIIITEIIREVK